MLLFVLAVRGVLGLEGLKKQVVLWILSVSGITGFEFVGICRVVGPFRIIEITATFQQWTM